jgi:transcriptional regulator NrdR family protein
LAILGPLRDLYDVAYICFASVHSLIEDFEETWKPGELR